MHPPPPVARPVALKKLTSLKVLELQTEGRMYLAWPLGGTPAHGVVYGLRPGAMVPAPVGYNPAQFGAPVVRTVGWPSRVLVS